MEGSGTRRPAASGSPRRRSRSIERHQEKEYDYANSEAASRFEPSVRREPYVPVAYPVAEVAPVARGATAVPYRGEEETSEEDSEGEQDVSDFGESQFGNSEFQESHLGTEYSLYGNSEFAGEDGGGGSGGGTGERFVGSREWSRQQQSQNSSQFTAESEGPWAGPGDPRSRNDPRARRTGRTGRYAGEDGTMHDLPPMPEKAKQPSNHSVLSHDLSGFSDFDPKPRHHARGSYGSGGDSYGSGSDPDGGGGGGGTGGGDITAPHPAPSDRHYYSTGLTGAAAAAADADARNLQRKEQRERELVAAAEEADRRRAEKKKKKAALAAAAAAAAGGGGVAASAVSDSSGRSKSRARPPAPHGGSDGGQKHYEARGGARKSAAVRDVGDSKEVDGSEGGMSAFRASTLEAQRVHGDPFDERPRNENGTTGEYATPTYHSLFFTPLMFLLCFILLLWEFALNDWVAEPIAENPSYGPSVETLITAGAKRTDLIVDDGDWWRLISPMFLHAGVVHFLFNMVGFLQVGAMVERVFGWWRVGAIYLVGGVFGTIVSAVFVPTQVMVGASGAIFAVFGALWADLWQNWSVNQDRCRMFTVLTVLTAVNIVLGLMPYLDNFAHIGGMLMGFLMGLGLLVQKREDDLGDRLGKKCYQRTLQLVAAIGVPLLLIIGLSLLYGRSDPAEWCGWCENISCVEFPPGDSPWWACDECSTVGFTAEQFSDGTISITCPDNSVESSDECSAASDDSLVDCCISLCL